MNRRVAHTDLLRRFSWFFIIFIMALALQPLGHSSRGILGLVMFLGLFVSFLSLSHDLYPFSACVMALVLFGLWLRMALGRGWLPCGWLLLLMALSSLSLTLWFQSFAFWSFPLVSSSRSPLLAAWKRSCRDMLIKQKKKNLMRVNNERTNEWLTSVRKRKQIKLWNFEMEQWFDFEIKCYLFWKTLNLNIRYA